MIKSINKQTLIDFEHDIANIYSTGIIPGPVHLRNGNESALIEIFKEIDYNDYVFCTWASHLEALLHGIDPNDVKNKILEGKSITLCWPERNFYSSAIVGGTCPIAVGVANALKNKNSKQKVWCFIGDMGAMTGIFMEAARYARNLNLPVTFVVQDNDKSVNTKTNETWRQTTYDVLYDFMGIENKQCLVKIIQAENTTIFKLDNLIYYFQYQLDYAHHGLKRGASF